MTWQNDPAGLGVGKNYGTFNVGGTKGRIGGVNSRQDVVFEITAEEYSRPYEVKLLPNYLIEGVTLEVTEAFDGAATLALDLDGGATDLSLTPLTVGKLDVDLGLSDLAGATSTTVSTLSVVKGGAPTAGKARVIVRYVV